MVRLIPLGGANEIGASCTLVEVFGARIIVDAGMRPSAKGERYPDFDSLAARGEIDAVLITHAHNDHIGALPVLHRRFPTVPIFTVIATARLTRLILRDSVAIMERDFEGDVDFGPEDVDAVGRAFIGVDFYHPTTVVARDDVRVSATFIPAGHILGAAMIALEAEHVPSGRIERVLMGGDVSFFDQPTIPAGDLEALRGFSPTIAVCEGTYGAEEHPDLAIEEARLAQRVAAVLRRGGRVLIPAFAIGRAQNVALILRNAQRDPERIRRLLSDPDFVMPEVPIVLDGMCRSVADQYHVFRSLLQPSLQDVARREKHAFYTDEGLVRPISSAKEREIYLEREEPFVVIASSGMLNGGPSVSFARALAGDPKSAILLCGYQDEESAGALLRRMSREEKNGSYPSVRLGDDAVELRCEVDQYNLSAHSDARDIERFLDIVRPLRLVLVHGTPGRLAALQARLEQFAGRRGIDVVIEIAHVGEAIEADGAARFDAMAFSGASSLTSSWLQHAITGRPLVGQGEVGAATPWITAALFVGRDRPLSGEDLARLGHASADQAPIAADDVALAREIVVAEGQDLWQEAWIGKERFFVPVGPQDGVSLAHSGMARISRLARADAVRSMRSGRDLSAHWERIRELGIQRNDLILFVDGGREHLRLLPGVVLSEASNGFRAMVPTAVESEVNVNQIVARVGPWPAVAAPAGVPTPFDVRLLFEIRQALSAFLVEGLLERLGRAPSGNGHERKEDVGGHLSTLWMMVARRVVSPLGAAVGSALLTHWGEEASVKCKLHDLIDLLGGEQHISPAMVVAGLRDLANCGLIQMRNHEEGLDLQWSVRMLGRLSPVPTANTVLQRLGPAFERLLRRAFSAAVMEVGRLGLAGGRDRGLWLAAPNGTRSAQVAAIN